MYIAALQEWMNVPVKALNSGIPTRRKVSVEETRRCFHELLQNQRYAQEKLAAFCERRGWRYDRSRNVVVFQPAQEAGGSREAERESDGVKTPPLESSKEENHGMKTPSLESSEEENDEKTPSLWSDSDGAKTTPLDSDEDGSNDSGDSQKTVIVARQARKKEKQDAQGEEGRENERSGCVEVKQEKEDEDMKVLVRPGRKYYEINKFRGVTWTIGQWLQFNLGYLKRWMIMSDGPVKGPDSGDFHGKKRVGVSSRNQGGQREGGIFRNEGGVKRKNE